MRYALVIAMLLGSTLLAQAEPIDRDKWIAQTGRASKSCLAKFLRIAKKPSRLWAGSRAYTPGAGIVIPFHDLVGKTSISRIPPTLCRPESSTEG